MVGANISNVGGLKSSVTISENRATLTASTAKKVALGTLELKMDDTCEITSMTGVFNLDEFKDVLDTIKETIAMVNDRNSGK